MFEQLQDRLARALKNIKGQGKISEVNIEDAMRDVRRALLEADVNFKVARDFVKQVKEKAQGGLVLTSVKPGQQFIKILQDELTEFLGGDQQGIRFNSSGQTVIVMAGLQGSGKTTSSAKIARFLKIRHNKKPFLIAADLQRPAAMDQLEVLGRQINVPVYVERISDPAQVVKNGLSRSKELQCDVVIIDTAGRLHVDDGLMDELKQIIHVANPTEIFFVADGMTGQDAVNSSMAFSQTADLSGIILTKMDGDARGGAALSIRKITGQPVKFIGTGEGIEAIEIFHPDRLSKRILGMGDIVTFVEKAQSVIDEKEAERLQKRLVSNTFTLEDFKSQLKQIQSMGPLSQMMNMIPGAGKLKGMKVDEKQLVWVEAIINSMTVDERKKPEIINGSRRKRIARGAGRPVFEVNQLLKQFSQMKKMMRNMGNMKKGRIPFGLN
ncbi:MAG: signal recognition particle protein [Candidatus Marinimicrobia bacterium]|jgi:signal recognition particle subunit SRP54|nr:signal recognition particle protein [Candidatus Neomarinimicrobiota bacterium]MBT3634154.1 signal recognition particle protein [Candidatus Neomarinimicrobiota bacterium]MBT3683191.1 signal recognition particle protein [Candidatus Neomarinimicrobiota bacterium]MBT3759761.1 signal recognition particle protein [Candidatus Neomarinimicrobiota bacterium]MBT3895833.1 signal recognition particle protein [Candidatus Neomarinimicrobiota bacterium]